MGLVNSVRHEKAIGVLDSGVGGLTVAKEIMRQLPKESIYYFGDTKRCPYGSRTTDEVYKFTLEMINFLKQFPLKAIVIACNTATSVVLPHIQHEIDIPIIGVINAGARAAIKNTQNNNIGIIGTNVTINSNAYKHKMCELNPNINVLSLACPTLAPLVEKELNNKKLLKTEVRNALQPLLNTNIDTLVLGCTHYPHLTEYIQEILEDNVSVISSSEETARELSAILEHNNLLSLGTSKKDNFYVTGSVEDFNEIAEKWLQKKIDAHFVNLESTISI
ncbi:glutamate racemase [Bacillus cereus]|uniref:glutamate racemase n=1 Tax=Bacillus cereus TaxID=1396 RepID=UPI0010BEBF3A|nr:glutamate racemase [Bacillus cereus]